VFTVTTCKKSKVIENINQSLQTIIATRCSTIYLRDRFSFLRAYQMFVPSAAVLPPDDAQLLHLLSGNTRGHGPVLMIFGLVHHIIILMSYSCHRGTDKNHILLYTCTALGLFIVRNSVNTHTHTHTPHTHTHTHHTHTHTTHTHTHTHTQNERRCQILTLFSVKFRAAVPTEEGISFWVAYCCHLTVTFVTRPLCSVETNSLIRPRRFAVIVPNAAKISRSILAT